MIVFGYQLQMLLPWYLFSAVDGKNGVYLSESNGTYSSTFNSPVDATIDITNYNSSSKTVSGTFLEQLNYYQHNKRNVLLMESLIMSFLYKKIRMPILEI